MTVHICVPDRTCCFAATTEPGHSKMFEACRGETCGHIGWTPCDTGDCLLRKPHDGACVMHDPDAHEDGTPCAGCNIKEASK